MHRQAFGIRHFFQGHAMTHHNIYQGDRTYSVGDRDPDELTFSWWAFPMVPLMHAPIIVALYFAFGLPSAIAMLMATLFYYVSYEYLHYSMHAPQGRWIEKQAFFHWLNDHHLQHHRKHFTNLNVFIPIADYVFCTRRSSASPGSEAIARIVGHVPENRRRTVFSWLKRSKVEVRSTVGYLFIRMFKYTKTLTG